MTLLLNTLSVQSDGGNYSIVEVLSVEFKGFPTQSPP